MKRIATAALLLLLSSLAACGSSDNNSDATPQEGGADGWCTEDRIGGEVTYGTPVAPTSLDPNLIAASNATTAGVEMAAIYGTLMFADGAKGTVEPNILDEVTPNDDATEWTLKIHEGVTFGNGDPLDADAFIASVNRSKDATTQGLLLGQALLLLDAIEKVDDQTVVFRFTSSWSEFGDLLASRPFMIVNTKIADERGDAFATNPEGAGAGPYEFVKMTPNEEIVLKAKEDWWGGPVCLETVRVIPTPEARLAADTLKTGESDFTTIGDPIVASELEADGANGLTAEGNMDIMVPNTAEGFPGADETFRLAMAAAIDTDVVNQRAFEGTLKTSPGIATLETTSYFSDELEGPSYDPEEAKALVAEAKANGWDGKTRLLGREGQEELVLTLQALLEAAGMDVSTEIVPTSELVQRVSIQHDFDIALWQMTSGPGSVWASLNRFAVGAPRNDSQFNDPAMDEALAGLRTAGTDEERQAAMATLQELWNAEVPALIVAERPAYVTWADRLQGVTVTGSDYAVLQKAFVQE